MSPDKPHSPVTSPRWIAGGSILAGLGGLLGASCCVLPLLLLQLGVGSAIVANLAYFAEMRDYFLVGTVALVVVGMVIVLRRGRPSRRILILFGLSLALVTLALVLPSYEGDLIRWIRQP